MKKVINSFKRAGHGLKQVWQDEQNFRIEIIIGIIVLALAIYLPLSHVEIVIVFIMIGLVLLMEIVNTALERISDILQPRIRDYIAIIKNLMAAAVLLVSILSIVIGLFIFLPYLF